MVYDQYEIYVEDTPVLIDGETTFGHLREVSHGPPDAPATHIAPRGVHETYDDEERMLDAPGRPPSGKLVFLPAEQAEEYRDDR